MGRGQPTYDLEHLQQLVGQGSLSRIITDTALQEAASLGLGVSEIVEAVLGLTPAHFYKSMEAEKRPGYWQDVYRREFREMELYVKLQIAADGRAVIVQC